VTVVGHLLAVGSLSGLTGWLQNNLLDVVLLGIGVLILVKARGQNHREALTAVAIVLIGLFVVGLSVGGGALNLGQWLTNLVTS
jgi:hypothetical protein